MNENKKWHAIYTRQGRERKVSEILTRKKIENYCPINKVMRPWGDPKKLVPEPLFTSNIFVKVAEDQLTHLMHTDGVINFVYWLGQPAVICQSEIETVKSFLNEHQTVKLEKVGMNLNNSVTATADLFLAKDYLSHDKDETPRVMLPSLGYVIVAAREGADREIIFRNLIQVEAQAG